MLYLLNPKSGLFIIYFKATNLKYFFNMQSIAEKYFIIFTKIYDFQETRHNL